MSRKAVSLVIAIAAVVTATAAPAPVAAQTCGPDPDGRVANADYRETVIFWEPIVEYERMVLTIGGPCEDIVKVFGRGEPIVFDLREIERVQDGAYTWEIRRISTIDAATQKALKEARARDDDSIWWNLFQKGAIPAGPYIDSESFQVIRGVIVPPGAKEEGQKAGVQAAAGGPVTGQGGPLQAGVFASLAPSARSDSPLTRVTAADQVIPDDLIVQGSLCVGFDCVNNESFSFDTIRMKENNLRIKFDDTSTLAGFPATDWQLTANDSASGGASKFSIEDISGARVPFTVRAGAPNNSIFVASTGRVGLRTATPVLDLHINTSNTPGIRLEQNSSGGFTAQTWDIAGNEANFFVRDVTGGSTLPFRIRPGAPTSSIDISADGEVGIGTASPDNKLHVTGSDGATKALIEETNGTATAREVFEVRNNGNAVFVIEDTTIAERWTFTGGSNFLINNQGNGGVEYTFGPTGNFTAAGSITPNSSRVVKEGFSEIDARELLARVLELPITTWTYKDDPETRHIGPMSEDFFATFAVGSTKGISTTDGDGVAFAAIQGLHQELTARDAEIVALRAQLAEFAARLERLEKTQ